MNIQLTDEQELALTKVFDWFYNQPNKQEFRLGGYAGTGKTTLVNALLDPMRHAGGLAPIKEVVCAFTGKACHVLRKKGIHSAQTIHSLIYDCIENPDGTTEFILKSRIHPSYTNLIIVDEASMISSDLYRDLKTFNIKLLFIGDPGQLEPIGDNPNLMKAPDYVLSKIHRQAALSPIITLAARVRTGGSVLTEDTSGSVIIKSKFVPDDELAQADQVLCAKNATRSLLNTRIRNARGRTVEVPFTVGEKIICLRNNKQFRMFNGLISTVDAINRETYDSFICNLRDEADKIYYNIPVWKKPFLSQLTEDDVKFPPPYLVYCDYGYAITVHKSQGSEWPHVIVYHEVMWKTDMARWCYTAITRAAEKLTYLK